MDIYIYIYRCIYIYILVFHKMSPLQTCIQITQDQRYQHLCINLLFKKKSCSPTGPIKRGDVYIYIWIKVEYSDIIRVNIINFHTYMFTASNDISYINISHPILEIHAFTLRNWENHPGSPNPYKMG